MNSDGQTGTDATWDQAEMGFALTSRAPSSPLSPLLRLGSRHEQGKEVGRMMNATRPERLREENERLLEAITVWQKHWRHHEVGPNDATWHSGCSGCLNFNTALAATAVPGKPQPTEEER